MIILTWVSSSLIITPQIFSTNGFFLEGFLISCTFDYFSRDIKSRLLLGYMIVFGYLIPIIIITFSYVSLYKLIKTKNTEDYNSQMGQSTRRRMRSNSSFYTEHEFDLVHLYKIYNKNNKKTSLNQADEEIDELIKNQARQCDRFEFRRNAIRAYLIIDKSRHFQLEREIKVAKVILIKVIFFCFAWTPYVIVVLIAQFSSNIEQYITPETTSLPSLFAKSSIIFNALIYTLTQKECCSFYFKLFLFKKPILLSNKNSY